MSLSPTWGWRVLGTIIEIPILIIFDPHQGLVGIARAHQGQWASLILTAVRAVMVRVSIFSGPCMSQALHILNSYTCHSYLSFPTIPVCRWGNWDYKKWNILRSLREQILEKELEPRSVLLPSPNSFHCVSVVLYQMKLDLSQKTCRGWSWEHLNRRVRERPSWPWRSTHYVSQGNTSYAQLHLENFKSMETLYLHLLPKYFLVC